MYDDDNDEEESETVVYEVAVPDEEDFYDDDDDTPSNEELANSAFAAKGFADRALVDEQAKAADGAKKKKRDELVRLKQEVIATKSLFTKKQHELGQLELVVKKDHYLDTRDRVEQERNERTEDATEKSDNVTERELNEIQKKNDREGRKEAYTVLIAEVAHLKTRVNDMTRAIASLERELLQS